MAFGFLWLLVWSVSLCVKCVWWVLFFCLISLGSDDIVNGVVFFGDGCFVGWCGGGGLPLP